MVSIIIKEIQEKLDNNAVEKFVRLTVPELFFQDLGLEYIDTDTVGVIMK